MKKLLFLLPFFIANLAIAQIPTNGLVGYWPFNGNANDESGNGNDGTVYGALLTTDRFENSNSSFNFNGVDNYIDFGNNETLKPNSEITISVWINPNTIAQWRSWMTTRDLTEWGNSPFLLWMDADGDIEFGITTSGLTRLQADNYPLSLNTWTNIIVVYDGAEMSIFKNGNLVANIPKTGNIDYTFFHSLKIGAKSKYSFFDGKIDDIRIYNRALTQSEITALYNESNTSNPDPTPQNTWQTNEENIFYYNGTGNVGIGTNTPAAKLTVDGPILSTEVLVKTDISEYPDFVFKPEYKLRTIEETEQYIKENGHLPEIPKASEVEEGISLGEMNTKLLQKIEELTLYTIEQQKKIDKLIEENKEQNTAIEELKNKIEGGNTNDK